MAYTTFQEMEEAVWADIFIRLLRQKIRERIEKEVEQWVRQYLKEIIQKGGE